MGVEGGTISAGGIGGVTAGIGAAGGGVGIGVSLGGIGRGFGEGGTIGGVASVGPVLSAEPFLGGGSLSLAREFGPVMTAADIGPIMRDGPVKGGLAMFKPIGQINFNYQSGLNTAEAVLGAQSILAQARPQPGGIKVPEVFQTGLSDVILDPGKKSPVPQSEDLPFLHSYSDPVSETGAVVAVAEHGVVPQVQPDFLRPPLPAPALEPAITTKSVLATSVASQSQTETRTDQVVQTSLASVAEEQVEELVEEEVATDRSEEGLENIKEERVEELILSHAIDPKALEIRTRSAIQGAIESVIGGTIEVETAKGVPAEAENEGISQSIDGKRIVDNIVAKQSIEYRGEELNRIDPRGSLPDGSWEANQKKISNISFDSIADAVQRLPKVLAEDPPVLEGEGEPVTDENVATSLKYAPDTIHAAQIVIKRVIRMEKQVKVIKRSRQQPAQIIPIHEEVVEKSEGTPNPELAAALLVPQTT